MRGGRLETKTEGEKYSREKDRMETGGTLFAAGFFQLFNEKCRVRTVLNILEPASLSIRCIPIQI